jgi:hypothetical protein
LEVLVRGRARLRRQQNARAAGAGGRSNPYTISPSYMNRVAMSSVFSYDFLLTFLLPDKPLYLLVDFVISRLAFFASLGGFLLASFRECLVERSKEGVFAVPDRQC